jgi:hypothetical protein
MKERSNGHERFTFSDNGQWHLQKWNLEKRCWEGYEPTPGVKAYEEGSCRPKKKLKKSEEPLADDEIECVEWDDGTVDLILGAAIPEATETALVDAIAASAEYEPLEKKESFQLKAEHKSEKGGLTAKGRKAYNRATGSNLKAPQPQGGPRKRSFCARNKGQIDMHNIDCRATPEKRACKARRRWKC